MQVQVDSKGFQNYFHRRQPPLLKVSSEVVFDSSNPEHLRHAKAVLLGEKIVLPSPKLKFVLEPGFASVPDMMAKKLLIKALQNVQ